MSQRNWSGVLAALGGTVFLTITVGLIAGGYHFGYRLGEDAGNSAYSAKYHDNYATDRIERECIGNNLTGFELRECIEEQVKASYEYQTAYNDLKSQERMAFWAVLMGVFTGLTVLVTGVGVVYVARTLRATSDTLDATRVMASDQKRIGDSQVAASTGAVIAAREANRVAAQQFRAAFKPWISVEMKGPFLDMRVDENPIRRFSEGETERIVSLNAETHIHCIGDIPATIENFNLRLMEGPDWPYVQNPPPGFGASSSDFFSIMQKGDTLKVDPRMGITDNFMSFNSITLMPENRRGFMMRPPPITGHVIFSDPMGVRYEHRFAFVAQPTWGDSFTRYGGREHNGEREID